MAQRSRGPGELHRDLKALNQKEDRDLQHKLNMLDKQHRYTCKMLQQRRDSLMQEQRRVVMVKVVEPKATVDIAMKEIGEHADTEMRFRGIRTSGGKRSYTSCPQHHSDGCEQRATSAPAASAKPSGSVRRRGNIQSSLSLMQMKNIATIDSISEKELARRQQEALEEMQRLRQFQRETLHQRVAAFIEQLRDKIDM